MLPFQWVKKWCSNATIAALLCIVYVESAIAAVPGGVNIASMIENLSKTVPQLMMLVTAFAYVMGFYFIIHGIVLLKKYGEQRTMMSSEGSLKGPIIWITVGAAMIYLPSSVQSGLGTFWTEPTPYAYIDDQPNQWSQLINACFMIVQLIGTIAFIRGLILFTHMGGQGGQQGTFGKALTHIIGGIMLIDIYDFMKAIFNTFALGQL